jgi:starch synthase (maltosyl-transferring)
VGQGSQLDRLHELVQETELAERIHFLGWRSDVAEILAASKALVLPSRWEGMPNVVLEAMASRLPVVATDVEGSGELLRADADHQLVRFGDTEKLAEKLAALVENPTLAAAIGASNRRWAEERFGIGQMVAAYQDLWESVRDWKLKKT